MDKRQKCIVRYQIVDYPKDEEEVYCDESRSYDQVIAKAKEQVSRRCGGSLPHGRYSFWSVSREDINEERFLTKNISQ